MPVDHRLKDAMSASGTLSLATRKILEALMDVGGTWDDIHRFDEDPGICRQVGKLLIRKRIDWLEKYTFSCPSQPRISLDELKRRHGWIDAMVEPDNSLTEPVRIRLVRIVAELDEEVDWPTFNERVCRLGSKLGFQHLLPLLEDLRSIDGAGRRLGCERMYFPGTLIRSDTNLSIPGVRFNLQQGILDVVWKRIGEPFDCHDWVAAPVNR